MSLSTRRDAIQAELAALAGAVTYRQLADQLKLALADAQRDGLSALTVTTPAGVSVSYPSLGDAVAALAQLEALAAADGGTIAAVAANLR